MELASNVARRDTFNRKGRNAFVPYGFLDYSKFCEKDRKSTRLNSSH